MCLLCGHSGIPVPEEYRESQGGRVPGKRPFVIGFPPDCPKYTSLRAIRRLAILEK